MSGISLSSEEASKIETNTMNAGTEAKQAYAASDRDTGKWREQVLQDRRN